MPRKKWINRNDPFTQTYHLLYRPQNDPLLHEEHADERALFPIENKNQDQGQQQQSQSQSQFINSSSSLPSSSSPSLFSSTIPASTTKGLRLSDLENTQDVDLDTMRENEGEAAQYGIFYDDSNYDYMQHLRDVGRGGDSGESHFVEAVFSQTKGKGKGKFGGMKLEDALRAVDLDGPDAAIANGDLGGYGGSGGDTAHENEYSQHLRRATSVFEDGFSTFSKSDRNRSYQNQQDVPDEIAGFQPNMDPRLREALEALDDDAYVDDLDSEDVFGALGNAGKNEGEIDLTEFENCLEDFDDQDDDGWQSDVTEKAVQQPKGVAVLFRGNNNESGTDEGLGGLPADAAAAAAAEDGDWLRDFAKYKRDVAAMKRLPAKPDGSIIAPSAANDKAPTLYTLNGTPLRQKKRKGALTNPSTYSMTSSSLARTDGLQLLDARFDQVEKMYALDETDEMFNNDDGLDSGMSMISGLTGKSRMSTLSTTSFADEGAVRGDFDGMMDDFLGDWNKSNPGGKRKGAKGKRGKNGNEKYGLAQLDEIRTELGRGRVVSKPQKV